MDRCLVLAGGWGRIAIYTLAGDLTQPSSPNLKRLLRVVRHRHIGLHGCFCVLETVETIGENLVNGLICWGQTSIKDLVNVILEFFKLCAIVSIPVRQTAVV